MGSHARNRSHVLRFGRIGSFNRGSSRFGKWGDLYYRRGWSKCNFGRRFNGTVAGWASTSLKYCKKTIDIVAGSTIVGKTSLRWEKTAGNIIRFGNKDQLRKVLNLAVGSGTQAHHIIPWEHCGHPLIQKAASNGTLGDNAFHMNELLNGIELGTVQHLGSHANYNTVVFNKLENLFNNNGGLTISAELAENLVRNLANQIRTWIVTHPNTSVNQIVL